MVKLQDRFSVELRLHRFTLCTRRSGALPMRVGGATSELDVRALMPLYVTGCGRIGVPHWATSVDYCKYMIIDPAFCGSRFSTGMLLAKEDFTCFYFSCSSCNLCSHGMGMTLLSYMLHSLTAIL